MIARPHHADRLPAPDGQLGLAHPPPGGRVPPQPRPAAPPTPDPADPTPGVATPSATGRGRVASPASAPTGPTVAAPGVSGPSPVQGGADSVLVVVPLGRAIL